MTNSVIPDDAIQMRSYFIWESEGRPHGRDLDHWLRAAVELGAAAAPEPAAKAAPVAKAAAVARPSKAKAASSPATERKRRPGKSS